MQRTIHVSTAAPGHVTPTGHFHVYAKSLMSWSNLFHVWLPYASYVVGGDAIHCTRACPVPGVPRLHPRAGAGGALGLRLGADRHAGLDLT